MLELFAAWRTVLHVTEVTGLSVAALAGLTLLALYVPGFRRLAILAAIAVGIGYAGLLTGAHVGRGEITAQWDAANVREEAARVARDAAVRNRAESDFKETIARLEGELATRKRGEDGYASNLLGDIARGVTARCELGADAVRLRNPEARPGGTAGKPRRRDP